LVERAPCLRLEALGGGLAESGAADIDVHGLHQGYCAACASAAARCAERRGDGADTRGWAMDGSTAGRQQRAGAHRGQRRRRLGRRGGPARRRRPSA
jgi:hypothetical protein